MIPIPQLAFIQNLGTMEWMIILVVCLLIFGHKLPGLARSMGTSVSEFKKGIKEGEAEVAAMDKAEAEKEKTDLDLSNTNGRYNAKK